MFVRQARLLFRSEARALALALLLPLSATSFGAQDDGRGWRWVELELDVWIEPDFGSMHLQGVGRLVLAAESSSGPELELNGALLEFAAVGSPGAAVELGTRLQEELQLATARLRFATPKTRGAEIRVDFECQSIGRSGQFAVDTKAALASCLAWYPVPLNGPDGPLPKMMAARGVTRFHLPSGWNSVSNGERVAGGEPDVETWNVSLPIARSFACAPFSVQEQEVDNRRVGIYRLRSAKEPADVELRAVAESLRLLEARYGPYPYPSYRVAEVPVGVGDFLGSSEQGFIMVKPVAFDAPDGNLALFAHELAHGWWGNQVYAEGPGSMLLTEALAQYSAVIAIEGLEGEAAATEFLRFSRPGYVSEQCARGYFQIWRDGSDQPLSAMGSGGNAHLLADSKGHWVYHMLNPVVGDERFFATLRSLIRDFAETPLTLPELRARFQRAAPEANLPCFFAQWLDREGAPILECDWSADGDRALVSIRQVQPGEPYHLPLEVAVDSAAGRRLHSLELEQRESSFSLPGAAPPTGVELDPRHRLLIWTSEYGPKPTE